METIERKVLKVERKACRCGYSPSWGN